MLIGGYVLTIRLEQALGTHEQLIAENGRYADLFELQAADYG